MRQSLERSCPTFPLQSTGAAVQPPSVRLSRCHTAGVGYTHHHKTRATYKYPEAFPTGAEAGSPPAWGFLKHFVCCVCYIASPGAQRQTGGNPQPKSTADTVHMGHRGLGVLNLHSDPFQPRSPGREHRAALEQPSTSSQTFRSEEMGCTCQQLLQSHPSYICCTDRYTSQQSANRRLIQALNRVKGDVWR